MSSVLLGLKNAEKTFLLLSILAASLNLHPAEPILPQGHSF